MAIAVRHLLLALLSIAGGGLAEGQGKIVQLLHTTWTARDGAPQAVTRMIRAEDGGFWVGSEAGLFKFDGLSFTQFRSPEGQSDLPSSNIRSLLLAKDGALWVGTDFEGAARIAHGHMSVYRKRDDGLGMANVSQLQEVPDGSIWALTNPAKLARFGNKGVWETQTAPDGNPAGYLESNFSIRRETSVTQAGHLYRRAWGERQFRLTDVSAHFDLVAEAPDKTLWLAESLPDNRSHLEHFIQDGSLIASLFIEKTPTALVPVEGSLWMAFNSGLARLPLPESNTDGKTVVPLTDKIDHMQGLSADRSRALLRDADGNVWSGGMKGLDRFRPGRLVAFPYLLSPDVSLCSTGSGHVVVADTDGHVYTVANGSVSEKDGVGDIHCLSCGIDDAWFVDHKQIGRTNGDHLSVLPPVPNWRPFGITTLAEMNDHTLILNGVSGGPWVLDHGKYVSLSAQGLTVTHPPIIMFLDSKQRLWLGYGHPVWVVKMGRPTK